MSIRTSATCTRPSCAWWRLDHEQLSFFFQGLDQQLTGVEHRRVIEKALV